MLKGRVSCSLNTVRRDFALEEELVLCGFSIPDLGQQVIGKGHEKDIVDEWDKK